MIGSLTARLLDTTAEDHGAIETSALMVALQARTLPAQKIYQLLQAHHAMAELLERGIRSACNSMLHDLWREDLAKSEMLSADLVTLSVRLPHAAGGAPPASVAVAVGEYAQYIRYALGTQPLALAGYLFAREGGMLDAPGLRDHVAAILGTTPGLLRYFNASTDPTQQWRRFRMQLEAEVATRGQQNVVVAGARDAFRLLRQLYAALSEDAEQWPTMHDDLPAPVGVVLARPHHESSSARALDPA